MLNLIDSSHDKHLASCAILVEKFFCLPYEKAIPVIFGLCYDAQLPTNVLLRDVVLSEQVLEVLAHLPYLVSV